MKSIGIIKSEQMSENTKQILAEKKAQFEKEGSQTRVKTDDIPEDNPFPANASLCNKCHNKSVIVMDGCQTCLNCGDSKCG